MLKVRLERILHSMAMTRAQPNSTSRYYTRSSDCGQSSRKRSATDDINSSLRVIKRSGVMYLAAATGSMCVLKPGISNSESKGHADRIQGKPPRADWGYSMAVSVPVNLGFCTRKESEKRLRIYEFAGILGFRHFSVNPDHEVCFLST
jgi:hypothetical protein